MNNAINTDVPARRRKSTPRLASAARLQFEPLEHRTYFSQAAVDSTLLRAVPAAGPSSFVFDGFRFTSTNGTNDRLSSLLNESRSATLAPVTFAGTIADASIGSNTNGSGANPTTVTATFTNAGGNVTMSAVTAALGPVTFTGSGGTLNLTSGGISGLLTSPTITTPGSYTVTARKLDFEWPQTTAGDELTVFAQTARVTANSIPIAGASVGFNQSNGGTVAVGFSAAEADFGTSTLGVKVGPITANATLSSAGLTADVTAAASVYGIADLSLDASLEMKLDTTQSKPAFTVSGSASGSIAGIVSLSVQNFTFTPTNIGTTSPLLSFGSAEATVSFHGVTLDGSANAGTGSISIDGKGHFAISGGAFAAQLSLESGNEDGLGVPDWLPIKNFSAGAVWGDVVNHPSDFIMTASADFSTDAGKGLGAGGTGSLQITGGFRKLVIDTSLIGQGKMPITGVDSAHFGIKGDVFGGALKADANISFGIAQGSSGNVFFGSIQGGFEFHGIGLKLRFGMTDRGPLAASIQVDAPIPIAPEADLYITSLYGGIEFNAVPLPAVSDASQLKSAAFTPGIELSDDQYDAQIESQALRQAAGGTGVIFTVPSDQVDAALASPNDASQWTDLQDSFSGAGYPLAVTNAANSAAYGSDVTTTVSPIDANDVLITDAGVSYVLTKSGDNYAVAQYRMVIGGSTTAGILNDLKDGQVDKNLSNLLIAQHINVPAYVTAKPDGNGAYGYDSGSYLYTFRPIGNRLAVSQATDSANALGGGKVYIIEAAAVLGFKGISPSDVSLTADVMIETDGKLLLSARGHFSTPEIKLASQDLFFDAYVDFTDANNGNVNAKVYLEQDITFDIPFIGTQTFPELIMNGSAVVGRFDANNNPIPSTDTTTPGTGFGVSLDGSVIVSALGLASIEVDGHAQLNFDSIKDQFNVSYNGELSATIVGKQFKNIATAGGAFSFGQVPDNAKNPDAAHHHFALWGVAEFQLATNSISFLQDAGITADAVAYMRINTDTMEHTAAYTITKAGTDSTNTNQVDSIAGRTFGIFLAHSLGFHKAGIDFSLAGLFDMEINFTSASDFEFDLFADATMTLGFQGNTYATLKGLGLLMINEHGVAADLSVSFDAGKPGYITADGNLTMVLNTTGLADGGRVDSAGKPDPFKIQSDEVALMASVLTDDNDGNGGLKSLNSLNGSGVVRHTDPSTNAVSYTLSIPAGAPFLLGNNTFDPARQGTAGPYFVIAAYIQHLTIANLLKFNGRVGLAASVDGFTLNLDGSLMFGPITSNVDGALDITSAGVAAAIALDFTTGNTIDGVQFQGAADVQINTTGSDKTVYEFPYDPTTGALSVQPVSKLLTAGVTIVDVSGSATLGALKLDGEFDLNKNETSGKTTVALSADVTLYGQQIHVDGGMDLFDAAHGGGAAVYGYAGAHLGYAGVISLDSQLALEYNSTGRQQVVPMTAAAAAYLGQPGAADLLNRTGVRFTPAASASVPATALVPSNGNDGTHFFIAANGSVGIAVFTGSFTGTFDYSGGSYTLNVSRLNLAVAGHNVASGSMFYKSNGDYGVIATFHLPLILASGVDAKFYAYQSHGVPDIDYANYSYIRPPATSGPLVSGAAGNVRLTVFDSDFSDLSIQKSPNGGLSVTYYQTVPDPTLTDPFHTETLSFTIGLAVGHTISQADVALIGSSQATGYADGDVAVGPVTLRSSAVQSVGNTPVTITGGLITRNMYGTFQDLRFTEAGVSQSIRYATILNGELLNGQSVTIDPSVILPVNFNVKTTTMAAVLADHGSGPLTVTETGATGGSAAVVLGSGAASVTEGKAALAVTMGTGGLDVHTPSSGSTSTVLWNPSLAPAPNWHGYVSHDTLAIKLNTPGTPYANGVSLSVGSVNRSISLAGTFVGVRAAGSYTSKTSDFFGSTLDVIDTAGTDQLGFDDVNNTAITSIILDLPGKTTLGSAISINGSTGTYNGSTRADTFTMSQNGNGSISLGLQAMQTSSAGATSSHTVTYTINNGTTANNLVLTGNGGKDTYIFNADSVATTIRGSSLTHPTAAQAGSSDVHIGSGYTGLSKVNGPITVVGSAGTETVGVLNSTTVGHSYRLTTGGIASDAFGTGGALYLTPGVDSMLIQLDRGTTSGRADGVLGNDVTISGLAAPTSVISIDGFDRYTVTGPLGYYLGVQGHAASTTGYALGMNSLTVNGTAAGENFAIDPHNINGSGSQVFYNLLSSLRVDGNGGNDSFNVAGTSIPTTLVGGSGDDNFVVTGNTAGLTLFGDTPIAAAPGTSNRYLFAVPNLYSVGTTLAAGQSLSQNQVEHLGVIFDPVGLAVTNAGLTTITAKSLYSFTAVYQGASGTYQLAVAPDGSMKVYGYRPGLASVPGTTSAYNMPPVKNRNIDGYRAELDSNRLAPDFLADLKASMLQTPSTDVVSTVIPGAFWQFTDNSIGYDIQSIADGSLVLAKSAQLGGSGYDQFKINNGTGPLVVRGYNATDVIDVTANGGKVNVFGGTGSDYYYVHGNAASLDLESPGGPGNENFLYLLNNTGTVTVNGHGGSGTYNLSSNAGTATINGGDGTATYNVLNPLTGTVNLVGSPTVQQTVVVAGSYGADTFAISDAGITGFGGPINTSGDIGITLNGNGGNDAITAAAFSHPLNITTGYGKPTIVIGDHTGAVTIDTSASLSATVTLGGAAHTLLHESGYVVVHGNGNTALTLDDSGNDNSNSLYVATINAADISSFATFGYKTGFGGVSFSGLSSLDLDFGRSYMVLYVDAVPPGITTTVDGTGNTAVYPVPNFTGDLVVRRH